MIQSPCHNTTKRTHNSTRKGGLRPSRNAPELGPTTRVPTGWSTARHKHHLHKSLHRAAPLMICILFLFHGLEFCPMISRSLYEMWPLSEQRIYTDPTSETSAERSESQLPPRSRPQKTSNSPVGKPTTPSTASRVTVTSVGECRQHRLGGSACFDRIHGDCVVIRTYDKSELPEKMKNRDCRKRQSPECPEESDTTCYRYRTSVKGAPHLHVAEDFPCLSWTTFEALPPGSTVQLDRPV